MRAGAPATPALGTPILDSSRTGPNRSNPPIDLRSTPCSLFLSMTELSGKRILLGVTGSIAAFKGAALASMLTKSGAEVRVVLSRSGARFVSAETFAALTGHEVAGSLWDQRQMGVAGHLELAEWPDTLVVAPATADVLARFALGMADDLLGAIALASRRPVVLAPAMETGMYTHPATQAHLDTLRSRGAHIVGPATGRLASGESGLGRMVEPEDIMAAIEAVLVAGVGRDQDLKGTPIVVTAGPTREAIDPVRFLSNRSSGKMGFSIAEAAAARGATVTMISGPVDSSLPARLPESVQVLRVETAAEMRDAVLEAATKARALVMAAAVADFRPAHVADQKLKKASGAPLLVLEATSDVLQELQGFDGLIRIGFAAETGNLAAEARRKLAEKQLDLVVANDVSGTGGEVFGSDWNTVTLFDRTGDEQRLPKLSKREVADLILDRLVQLLGSSQKAQ